MNKIQANELRIGMWVECVRTGEKRYVSNYKKGSDVFEDDGLVSGQPPSPYCDLRYYKIIPMIQALVV
jgi:hypothetical protein